MPNRHAVIVGISNYADGRIPDLRFAESDAQAVHQTLTDRQVGRFDPTSVSLLLGKKATAPAIRQALAGLQKAGPDDLVLVFFSGHGINRNGNAFWVTHESKVDDLPHTALPAHELTALLSAIPSKRVVTLLDCCYAAATVERGGTRDVGLSPIDLAALLKKFSGEGRVTIAGAGNGEQAIEAADLRASVFTYFLVRGLRGQADENHDRVVTLAELWRYLEEHVADEARRRRGLQRPTIHALDLTEMNRYLLTLSPGDRGFSIDLGGGVRVRFVRIPPDGQAPVTFLMGSPASAPGRDNDENQHEATIARCFYMSTTEITNAAYRRFDPAHDSDKYKGHSLDGDDQPVIGVSWEEANAFCAWLTRKTGNKYEFRLPTEAQWEFACRAGTTTAYNWGSDPAASPDYCNGYEASSFDKFGVSHETFRNDDGNGVSAPVGTFSANGWGLYDMHGNVWEWCQDRYGSYRDQRGTQAPASGRDRVSRGGSWLSGPAHCRSANRSWNSPEFKGNNLGFRIICEIRSQATLERRGLGSGASQ